jgi:alpha(1,3/1,4) fucosyltransferase
MLICYNPPDQGKPVLKVDFVDFGFIDKCNNFFVNLLSQIYTVVICDKPDVLFYSDTGGSHLHRLYHCKRIFWTGESTEPDFTVCDYAMTPRQIDHPRHCRLPYYVVGCECDASDIVKRPGEAEQILSENRHGCGVVISNIGKRAQYRKDFFYKLQERIPVFSGGRSMNNVGAPLAPGGNSKHAFLRRYRFNLCFENKSLPGYVTEKIVEAMWARCIPIYWGDPAIAEEFNPDSFVNVHAYNNETACLNHIEELETNDHAYFNMLSAPFFHGNEINTYYDDNRYINFLRSAIEENITPNAKRSKLISTGRWKLAKRMH